MNFTDFYIGQLWTRQAAAARASYQEGVDSEKSEQAKRLASIRTFSDFADGVFEQRRLDEAQTTFENNQIGARIESAEFGINQHLRLQQQRRDFSRQLAEAETADQQKELEKRTAQFTEYFGYINRLNLESKDQFILSAIQITATIIQQTLIRKAVEALGSGNFPAAIGYGVAAIGSSGIEQFLIDAQQRNSRSSSSRTFHNATNDALVEMAVSRALSSRSGSSFGHQQRMDNRQQARDVAGAVDEGIRTAVDVDQPIIIESTNQIIINDQVIAEMKKRERQLVKTRRV